MSPDECIKIISSLNNTTYGINNISTKLLKSIQDFIAVPLCELINSSFSTGVFPNILKRACVTPIFKNGDRNMINNFRPISVLPVMSKVVEKCMYERLNNYFTKLGIISSKQFGFMRGKSCFDAISNLLEYIYSALNDKKHVVSLFIDLKKAYDTVNHQLLINKLHSCGIRGVVLSWFESYLENRMQNVKIGESFSALKNISIGVPQGSILGGILFLIYINDLPQVSNKLFTTLFADDTCFSLSVPNYNKLIEDFNFELTKVYNWLLNNRLSLNILKTVAINFSNKNPVENLLPLTMNNSVIYFSDRVRYLGVIIDKNLSFKHHIDHICTKISKTLGIMYKMSNVSPKHILLKLYYALIYPYLLYCNVIWGGTSDQHLNKILLLQKRAVRIITNSSYLQHSDPIFSHLNILKIKDLYFYSCCLLAKKRQNEFTRVFEVVNTRNATDLNVRFQRLSVTQRSIYHNVPKYFNQLPNEFKQFSNLSEFKRVLRRHLTSRYHDL